LEIRERTRMTVAAILRDRVPLIAPEPTETLFPGDRLVVIGRQEDLPGFLRHVVG
jgi:K+/H+ antiporter YhaU regulatory subunit KhtT